MESKLDRRSFITTAAALTVGSLSVKDKGDDVAERAAVGLGLQAQRLAWAGVRLRLEKATLFLDPLLNPDVWGPALKDKFIQSNHSKVIVTWWSRIVIPIISTRRLFGKF